MSIQLNAIRQLRVRMNSVSQAKRPSSIFAEGPFSSLSNTKKRRVSPTLRPYDAYENFSTRISNMYRVA